MIMLCSLAVSFLLVGLIVQPIYIAKELTENSSVTGGWAIGGHFLIAVSLLTITAITVDRFLALHYHMRYATLVTKSRVKYTIVIDHFTVACQVTWPLNGSEAGGDLALIQTSLLYYLNAN